MRRRIRRGIASQNETNWSENLEDSVQIVQRCCCHGLWERRCIVEVKVISQKWTHYYTELLRVELFRSNITHNIIKHLVHKLWIATHPAVTMKKYFPIAQMSINTPNETTADHNCISYNCSYSSMFFSYIPRLLLLYILFLLDFLFYTQNHRCLLQHPTTRARSSKSLLCNC